MVIPTKNENETKMNQVFAQGVVFGLVTLAFIVGSALAAQYAPIFPFCKV